MAIAVAAGCGERPRKTPAEGALGPLNAQPATEVARAQPPPGPSVEGTPVLTCLQTELSPAVLFQTDEREISFFTDLEKFNRAAPSHAAFSTRGGPRPFKNGERLDPTEMEENWVLAWFAGARGWTNGDVPWVIYLQHKPRSMRLDTNGLHFQFARAAGHIACLPLYGIYVCLSDASTNAVEFDGEKVQTWEWGKVLHREPLMRVRYWASALREFPEYCEETFSVDRSRDTLTLRQKIAFVSIEDDWRTKGLKINPISPTLALASRDQSFPVKFKDKVMDFEMPTANGPYMAAQTSGPLQATFRNLQHVNEGPPKAATNIVFASSRGTWARWAPPDEDRERCIAAAQSAYRAGNIDGYNYGCYLFTRAFTRHHFEMLFEDYARTLQAKNRPASPSPTPPSQTRLIPAGEPSPFVLGIEREVSGPNSLLVQQIETADGEWPSMRLRLSARESPEHALNFGRVKVGGVPGKSVRQWHSHNTERIIVLR